MRSGGLRADVVWGCDPLTVQDYVDQGLVGGWTPSTPIPAEYRTDDYVGVALLYLVSVTGKGVPPPASWSDLAGPAYQPVAVPDPGLAASALGALGFFAGDPDYGLGYYDDLKRTGHAGEHAGRRRDRRRRGHLCRRDHDRQLGVRGDGERLADRGDLAGPGAIAVYGPIAIAADTENEAAAKDFISFVASRDGQELLAKSGSYPTLPGVPDPPSRTTRRRHTGLGELATEKDSLLAQYQKIFGG